MRARLTPLILPSVLLRVRAHLFLAIVVLIAAFASAFIACGGGNYDPVYQPGPLACEGLGKKSYHYTVNVVEEQTTAPLPPATPVTNGLNPRASWDIQGGVEAGDRVGSIDAAQHNEVTGGSGDVEIISLESGDVFYNIGQGWKVGSAGLAFQPMNVCNALAQDADTTKLGDGVPETINGVPSLKFSFNKLASQFTAREPDFAGGDADNYIKSLDGSVWIAEKGNLITKLDLTGSGQYEDGQKTISITLKFEVSDLDGDVKVEAPPIEG